MGFFSFFFLLSLFLPEIDLSILATHACWRYTVTIMDLSARDAVALICHLTCTARKIVDGIKVYGEDELKLGTGGGTPLCPFDCACCFWFRCKSTRSSCVCRLNRTMSACAKYCQSPVIYPPFPSSGGNVPQHALCYGASTARKAKCVLCCQIQLWFCEGFWCQKNYTKTRTLFLIIGVFLYRVPQGIHSTALP